MLTANIPYSFLKRLRAMPSWAEMAFAYEHQWVSSKTVIDYAIDRVSANAVASDDEIAIASASIDEPLAELLARVVSTEPPLDQDSLDSLLFRWSNVLLAWVYDQRANVDDILSIAADIYVDAGYPAQMAPFFGGPECGLPPRGSVVAERMVASIGTYVQQFMRPPTIRR